MQKFNPINQFLDDEQLETYIELGINRKSAGKYAQKYSKSLIKKNKKQDNNDDNEQKSGLAKQRKFGSEERVRMKNLNRNFNITG